MKITRPSDKQIPFWLITISVLIGLTLPMLIQDGMFMDGELYTCVAHNLSMGFGTFWFPQFSLNTMGGLTSFHEQPPLTFGIQALFFKLLGNSMYVERFYTFLMLCVTAWLIVVLWNHVVKNDAQQKQLGWVPVFIWITMPVAFWSYSNNMIENTMGIFTLSAVLFIFNALESGKPVILMWLLAGVFIFFATLSKGLPGLFPLAAPALYWLIYKRYNFLKVIYTTALLLAVPLIGYALLLWFPSGRDSLMQYFFKRAMARINDLPTVTNRFSILSSLIMDVLPQLVMVAVILFIGWRKKIQSPDGVTVRLALFFIAVGLAGTAPLMLTLVQKGFYYVPALPLFAIGFSVLIASAITNLTDRISVQSKGFRFFLFTSIVLLATIVVFSFMQIGKIRRDKETLQDVYAIDKVVPKFYMVSAPLTVWGDWSLQCYLMRYNGITIDCNKSKLGYYLTTKSANMDSLPQYEKVDITTSRYDLYTLKK